MYMNKILCECGSEYRKNDKSRHEKTIKHQEFIKNKIGIGSNEIKQEEIYESYSNSQDSSEYEKNEYNDNFLDNLNSNVYIPQEKIKEQEKEKEKIEKENKKIQKEQEKLSKKILKVNDEFDDDIFSSNPTPIHGKDKLILMKKINQYKILFKDQLKNFKIKKNATVQELNIAIDEMQNIIDLSSTNEFYIDGIIYSIKVIENLTVNSKNFNITGLSELLKLNPEFNDLCKQLFLKYGSFNNILPEYKIIFIVAVSANLVRNKNMNKDKINAYLDEEVRINN